MAIYFERMGLVQRSKGGNAVAAAAYATGLKLMDENTGEVYSYTRSERVAVWGVELPEGAPEELRDIEVLWSAAEAADTAKNAQTGRREVVALPRELTLEECEELVRVRARAYADAGMCVTWAIHDYESGNPHAHLVFTTRALAKHESYDRANPGGVFAAKGRKAYLLRGGGQEIWATADDCKMYTALGMSLQKVYRWEGPDGEIRQLTMDEGRALGEDWKRKNRYPVSKSQKATDWDTKEALVRWRKSWAEQANRALSAHWASVGAAGEAPTIDNRSYRERGIDKVPQIHVGVGHGAADRAASNELIRRLNEGKELAAAAMAEMAQRVRDYRKRRRKRSHAAQAARHRRHIAAVRRTLSRVRARRREQAEEFTSLVESVIEQPNPEPVTEPKTKPKPKPETRQKPRPKPEPKPAPAPAPEVESEPMPDLNSPDWYEFERYDEPEPARPMSPTELRAAASREASRINGESPDGRRDQGRRQNRR